MAGKIYRKTVGKKHIRPKKYTEYTRGKVKGSQSDRLRKKSR